MFLLKEYKKAESLEEAYLLNQKRSNRIVAGMLWLKLNKNALGTAIDLSGLGLDQIEETEQEFRIGCMTSLRDLECHPGLARYTDGAMKEALRHIVGVQFRNLATIGGSIYGRYGFSDVLTLFLAMDSFVELYKGGVMPLAEYASRPMDRDILVRVIVKKEAASFYYQSVRNQAQTDFPVLTCAAACPKEGAFRLAVGARPHRAVLLTDETGILQAVRGSRQAEETVMRQGTALETGTDLERNGSSLEKAAEDFAAYAKENLTTGSNLRGSAAYRTHLIGVLAKRAVQQLMGAAGSGEAASREAAAGSGEAASREAAAGSGDTTVSTGKEADRCE